VAYQLDRPGAWQIHPVFHVLLLSPYTETKAHGPNYSRPPPDLIGGEEFFKVEQIKSHRRHGRARTLQYLIKWKGSPESNNTWEPADLVLAPDLLWAYHKNHLLEMIKARPIREGASTTSPWSQRTNAPTLSHLHRCCAPLPTLPIASMSLSRVPACKRPSCALCPITAALTTPIHTHSSTGPSVRNVTVAIIPKEHLFCEPT
jgi:hypothetical protein